MRPPGLFPPAAYRRTWSAKRIEMASGRWLPLDIPRSTPQSKTTSGAEITSTV